MPYGHAIVIRSYIPGVLVENPRKIDLKLNLFYVYDAISMTVAFVNHMLFRHFCLTEADFLTI